MGCKNGSCGCPECEGGLETGSPAQTGIGWGLLAARAAPGSSDFWSVATMADLFSRSALPDDPNTREARSFLTHALSDSVRQAHLLGARFSSAQGVMIGQPEAPEPWDATGPDDPGDAPPGPSGSPGNGTPTEDLFDDFGWHDPTVEGGAAQVVPGPYYILVPAPTPTPVPEDKEKKKCCPEILDIEGTPNDPDANLCHPTWSVVVSAKWSSETPCSCDCCEVRQFVTIADQSPDGDITTPRDLLKRTPFYLRKADSIKDVTRSQDPWAMFELDGEVWQEDQSYGIIERVDPGKGGVRYEDSVPLADHRVRRLLAAAQTDEGIKAKLSERIQRYGVNVGGTPGDCNWRWNDRVQGPRCFRPGDRAAKRIKFRVVIRPKPGCDGDEMSVDCKLEGACWWPGEAATCDIETARARTSCRDFSVKLGPGEVPRR